jgi:hypothetical protein
MQKKQSLEQLHLFTLPHNIAAESTSAKNSLYLLTRILPFVFEHDEDNFSRLLFFENRIPELIPEEIMNKMREINHMYSTSSNAPSKMEDRRDEKHLNGKQQSENEPPVQQSNRVTNENASAEEEQKHREEERQKLEELERQKREEAEKQKREEEERQRREEAEKQRREEEENKNREEVEKQKREQQEKQRLEEENRKQGGKQKGKRGGKKGKKAKNDTAKAYEETEAANEEQKPEEREINSEIEVEKLTASTSDASVAVQQVEEGNNTESMADLEQKDISTEKDKKGETLNKVVTQEEEQKMNDKQDVEQKYSEWNFEKYVSSLKKFEKIGDKKLESTLAEIMIDTLMKAMFIPAFTVPVNQLYSEEPMKKHCLNNEFLWQNGVGQMNVQYSPSSELINNRYDVLRCMLACFTRALYLRVDQYPIFEDEFLTIAVSESMPFTIDVVYSLLNTILKYDPRGSLPYTTQLITDYEEKLVEISLQMLILLIHHNPASLDGKNRVREILAAINTENELNYMYYGFNLSLNNIVDSHNTYLPGSQKLVSFYEELLIGFWKVLEINKNFRSFICRETDISRIVVPLVFILQTQSKETAKFPMIQMVAFILLLLSGQREFSVTLNRPIEVKLPVEIQVEGTFADLIITTICKVIATDKATMRPLFECLLTIIANISPYIKSLNSISSTKLVELFVAFSSPKFVYTSDKNPQFVNLLLETFNNIIQYQYEGNSNLIYSIMLRSNAILELNKKPDLEKIRNIILERERKREHPIPENMLFLPTQQWVDSWKPKLPLNTVLTLINALSPEIERFCSKQPATTGDDVIKFIKKTTLVGLLPVPHTIIVRTFVTSPRIELYLATYCWGLIYLKQTDMFSARQIKLFNVNSL